MFLAIHLCILMSSLDPYLWPTLRQGGHELSGTNLNLHYARKLSFKFLAQWFLRRFLNDHTLSSPSLEYPLAKGHCPPLKKSKSPSPKEALWQGWLKLVPCFWWRSWKGEKFTHDGRDERQKGIAICPLSDPGDLKSWHKESFDKEYSGLLKKGLCPFQIDCEIMVSSSQNNEPSKQNSKSVKTSLYNKDLDLFKQWSLGPGRGNNKFYIETFPINLQTKSPVLPTGLTSTFYEISYIWKYKHYLEFILNGRSF